MTGKSGFDPSGGTAGTDWDLLSINDLNFESGQTFDINIMAISTDGSQGAPGSPQTYGVSIRNCRI